MDGIEARKRYHIDLCLDLGDEAEFRGKTTWFEHVELVHNALPELDLDEVSLEAELLGRRFSYPLLIEGMTGGTEKAYDVNRSLAEAADRLNIPMEVGSERAGIENRELAGTYRVAREASPKLFLIGNISGVQLAREGVGYAEKAVEMIEADALAIHLNCLQELVQPEGTPFFRGVLEAIRRASERLSVPLLVKEVGNGISREVAEKLAEAGVKAIDVAGAGGTNWTRIELERARGIDPEKAGLAELFSEWGIPTAASIIEASSVEGVEVIASGGIRNGLQIAKAIALGARFAGVAKPLLKPALRGSGEVERLLKRLAQELRAAMFLTGSRNIGDLRRCGYVLTGPLLEWAKQRVGGSSSRIRM